jgi:hypothetical protein
MPSISRCQVIPLPDHQASFQIDGRERLRWHFGAHYPRPFFYPLVGPSGAPLTRMGHPGDSGHDHHRSIWFAHHDMAGQSFWADGGKTHVRQKRWLAYQDGDAEAAMAALIGWHGEGGHELLEQELIAIVSDGRSGHLTLPGETLVELQSTFRPTAASIDLGKTNFGFLAVRVAKTIAAHFGGGKIADSEGRQGEPAIFGRAAAWMDYSGPVPGDRLAGDATSGPIEGITYFDHPANPGHPAKWHVREDGWMGAGVCLDAARTIRKDEPLVLRYLLHGHGGALDPKRATAVAAEFAHRPAFQVTPAKVKHVGFAIGRVGE